MRTSYLFIISLLAGIAYAVAAYAASQTANPESRLLLPRDGDLLQPQKSRIMGAVAADREDSLVVNVNTGCFSNGDVAGISIYMDGDTLSYVQEGRKHLFTTHGDTLSYLGYESRATRLTLDSPLPLLRHLSGGGEGFAGEWSGTVWHNGLTLLRKAGGASRVTVGRGWSVADGTDTVHGVRLLRWETTMRYADRDSLGREIPDTVISPSVSDMAMPSRGLMSESLLTVRDAWIPDGTRYPVAQRVSVSRVTGSPDGPRDTIPFSRLYLRYPPDLQRMDTGEEIPYMQEPGNGGGRFPELYSLEGDADLPVEILNHGTTDNTLTVSLSSGGPDDTPEEITLTLYSVSGIRLSEPVKARVGKVPQTLSVRVPDGNRGVLLLRIDAGKASATYKVNI